MSRDRDIQTGRRHVFIAYQSTPVRLFPIEIRIFFLFCTRKKNSELIDPLYVTLTFVQTSCLDLLIYSFMIDFVLVTILNDDPD